MRRIKIAVAALGLLFIPVSAFTQGVTLAPGAKYVALGSSFAAGPGIDNQLGGCGRSDANYSHIVAAELNLDLTNVSCNGATTANILDTPQNGAEPQINAVTADTALVTVTIGGNDISYTSSTFACSGKAASERCAANLDQASINAAVAQLPHDLGAMIDAVRARAPEATVVFVTYPRVFPEDAASCSELELSADDTAYLAALGQTLEDTFVSVTSSKQTRVADTYVIAEGHGPCAPSERWVNGATIEVDGIRYHPTGLGHEAMARLVLAALR